jgi:hypothetical protein
VQSEVIHNKWVNVIAVGFLDVTGAFINNRVGYNDATESVECAVLREIKTSECEAVRVFCVVRVMRKYADCIDQLSYLGAASVLLNRERRLLTSSVRLPEGTLICFVASSPSGKGKCNRSLSFSAQCRKGKLCRVARNFGGKSCYKKRTY